MAIEFDRSGKRKSESLDSFFFKSLAPVVLVLFSAWVLYLIVTHFMGTLSEYSLADEACAKAIESGTKVSLPDTNLTGYVEDGSTLYYNAPEKGCYYLIRWHTDKGIVRQWLTPELIQKL